MSLLSLGSLVVTEAVLDGTSDGITESSVVALLVCGGPSFGESTFGTVPDGTIASADATMSSGVLTCALSPSSLNGGSEGGNDEGNDSDSLSHSVVVYLLIIEAS